MIKKTALLLILGIILLFNCNIVDDIEYGTITIQPETGDTISKNLLNSSSEMKMKVSSSDFDDKVLLFSSNEKIIANIEVGNNRILTLYAIDSSGEKSLKGEEVIDLVANENKTVAMILEPYESSIEPVVTIILK